MKRRKELEAGEERPSRIVRRIRRPFRGHLEIAADLPTLVREDLEAGVCDVWNLTKPC